MFREWYKMICKKYYLALLLLLFMPFLFGIGYFFDLPYMMEANELSTSALDYCAEMQMLIKYVYFLIIIYLACDIFSGELEGGQLRLVITHVTSRRKIVLQKFAAICLFISSLHVLFWGVNFILYCLGNKKKNIPIVILSKNIGVYIGIFFGYLEAFFVCIAIAFLIGLFVKKIYTLIIVYFLWFACRYVDQIVSLKSIFSEFMADYLNGITGGITSINLSGYVVSLLFCLMIIFILIGVFRNKNIN